MKLMYAPVRYTSRHYCKGKMIWMGVFKLNRMKFQGFKRGQNGGDGV